MSCQRELERKFMVMFIYTSFVLALVMSGLIGTALRISDLDKRIRAIEQRAGGTKP